MKFFNFRSGATAPRAKDLQKNNAGNTSNFDYELCLLEDCKQKREANIKEMAALKIEDIDRTIAAYEERVSAYISRGKVIICAIIEEKVSQLKKAREIVYTRRFAPSFFLT